MKNLKEKRSLYLALAICLMAVGIAAFGTYTGVSTYMSDLASITAQDEDPEKPVTTPSPTATATPAPAVEEPEPSQEPVEAPVEAPTPEVEETQNETVEPETETANAPTYTLKEEFTSPINAGSISAPYSGGQIVYNETMKDWRTHNGIDIGANLGDPVYASNSGIVVETYNDLLLGNVVAVEHGEYIFYYCGLGDTALVAVGDIVSSATTIGSVSDIPLEPDSYHLHLEVRKDGAYIDPTPLVFGH